MDANTLIKQFGDGGWLHRQELWDWLRENGCIEGDKLIRDNWTDGEYHYQWVHSSGATFDLNANWYSANTFKPLVAWAISLQPSN